MISPAPLIRVPTPGPIYMRVEFRQCFSESPFRFARIGENMHTDGSIRTRELGRNDRAKGRQNFDLDSMMTSIGSEQAEEVAKVNQPSAIRTPNEIMADLKLEYGVESKMGEEDSGSALPGIQTGAKPSLSASTTGQGAKLSQIGELILMSDASIDVTGPGGEKLWTESRTRLAASLGCTAEDLEEIASSYGDSWMELILNERIRRGTDSIAMRDVSWDRLESAVLKKLLAKVDSNAVREVGELLAIARVANTASRGRGNMGKGNGGAGEGNQINIGFFPGNPQAGVLPAGDLGTIQLSLSSRVRTQLSNAIPEAKVIEGQSSRILDNIEMVDLSSVQSAVKESEE